MQIIAHTWTGIGAAERLVIETDGERIVFVLPDASVSRRRDAVVCPAGSLLIPGLHDAHCHLLEGGLMMAECDFDDANSAEDVGDVLRDYVREHDPAPGEWVRGRRLDETRVQVTRDDLDRVCPDRPVFIWTHDLHSVVVNSSALARVGISDGMSDPPGGKFERDESGRMSGVLRETAAHRVEQTIPPATAEQTRTALLRAQQYAFSLGLTAVSSSVRGDHLSRYSSLAESEARKIRMNIWPVGEDFSFDPNRFERACMPGYRMGTLKGFVDGALGSRSAAFYESYSDVPNHKGMLQIEAAPLANWIQLAHAVGWQIALHAIGDRGCGVVLDALERTGMSDLRLRIEHAQHVRESDIARFAQLGVIASMQPVHCTADMRFVTPRLGRARARFSYAWRSLHKAGVRLAFGSDWPVEDFDPTAGILAAVTRQDRNGNPTGGWFPEERLTAEETLRAYTAGSAYAAFWEKDSGTIEAGKLADFTLLSRDILRCPEDELRDVKALMTVVGGEIVYRDASF